MSVHSWLRIASVFIVGVLALGLQPNKAFSNLVFTFGFVHYVMALVYSRAKISQLLAAPREAFGLLSLVLLAAGMYISHASLFILFGVHHVLNEVYLLHRAVGESVYERARLLRFAAVGLNFLVYLTILRDNPSIWFVDHGWLFAALAGFYILFFAALMKMRTNLAGSAVIELALFEVLSLPVVAASFFLKIDMLCVVMYHYVFWAIYPMRKMLRAGSRPVIEYLCWNTVLTVGFLAVSPLSPLPYHFSQSVFYEQFRFQSFVHILMSFAVSVAHPGWVRRLFQPRQPAPLAASAVSAPRLKTPV